MHQRDRRSGQVIVLAMLLIFGSKPLYAHLQPVKQAVQIEFVSDSGQILRQFAVSSNASEYRAFLEAVDGKNYSIRVRNRTGNRIGLVAAVDGRNIISGRKSHLKASEPLYVLAPYASATYRGWRTSENQVHRFYFTDQNNSYAGAFGDFSAMGVAAVAVFQEKRDQDLSYEQRLYDGQDRPAQSEASPAAPADRARESLTQPGTGFGSKDWSPAVRVAFRPQQHPIAKYFVKYEWRESLCAKGIIRCDQERNRFWPDAQTNQAIQGEFAPYPPVLW